MSRNNYCPLTTHADSTLLSQFASGGTQFLETLLPQHIRHQLSNPPSPVLDSHRSAGSIPPDEQFDGDMKFATVSGNTSKKEAIGGTEDDDHSIKSISTECYNRRSLSGLFEQAHSKHATTVAKATDPQLIYAELQSRGIVCQVQSCLESKQKLQ